MKRILDTLEPFDYNLYELPIDGIAREDKPAQKVSNGAEYEG